MADMNWIKLNRKIWDSFIWSFENPKYTLAWIDMLLMANYKDKQIRCRGTVETVRRGSFVTSILKLAERWGMNRKTVSSTKAGPKKAIPIIEFRLFFLFMTLCSAPALRLSFLQIC